MLKVLSLTLLGAVAVCGKNKDLGVPGWSCDADVMKPSASVPTNANAVRYADIKVVGALGDSLTAANGAGAPHGDPLAIILQYRGLAFQVGGDKTLDEHITIPNILKKFNPNIFGYSKGIGGTNVWEVTQLNSGVPGAQAADLPAQARDLVAKMQSHDEVDMKNDWKLVNIFIGGNDICHYCEDKIHDPSATHSVQHFQGNISESIQIIYDNVPRVIVSLTSIFDMKMVRRVDKGQIFCDALHLFECHCESDKGYTDEEISDLSKSLMASEEAIMTSGKFDGRSDFTLVVQPMFENVEIQPELSDGDTDLSFFAADCFHFSQYGHAVVAKHLWNNIVEPVGMKNRQVNLSDASPHLQCPDASCPFFRTWQNSKDCAKFMTD